MSDVSQWGCGHDMDDLISALCGGCYIEDMKRLNALEAEVERLRAAPMYGPEGRWTQLRQERDDALAEVERLREALGEIAVGPPPSLKNKVAYDQWLIAKKALREDRA